MVVGGCGSFFEWMWVVFWVVVDDSGWLWMVLSGCGWLRVVAYFSIIHL